MEVEFIKLSPIQILNLRDFRAVVDTKIADCEKEGWSRSVSAGFIKGDIRLIWPDSNMNFFSIDSGHGLPYSCYKLTNCNLRELDELSKWLEEFLKDHTL